MRVRIAAASLVLAALAACAAQGNDRGDAFGGAGDPAGGETNAAEPGASSTSSSSSSGGSSSSSSSSGGSSSTSSSGGANDAGNGDASTTADASPVAPAAPFDANPCGGGAITSAEVLSHFAPAATTTTFGNVWASARKRNCQDQTGCQGWMAASSADLYRIQWNGSGFSFVNPTTLPVPGSGTITCTVPGPSCTLTIGPMTSNVYPPEQGRPLGITPRVAGGQVQVGNWSFDPKGNYLQYTSSVVTSSCLWGSMSGRIYGASGTYVETQLVVWGSF